MEIKYEEFHQLKKNFDKLESLYDTELYRHIDRSAKGSGFMFNPEDTERLHLLNEEMNDVFPPMPLMSDVPREIMYNLAGISNDRQVLNYLELIRVEVNTMFEVLAWNTDFHVFKRKSWSEVFESESGKNDPIKKLRISYLLFIELILGLRDFVDEKMYPGKEFRSLQGLINNPPYKKDGQYFVLRESPVVETPADEIEQGVIKIQRKSKPNDIGYKDIFKPEYQHLIDDLSKKLYASGIINADGGWNTNKEVSRVFYEELKYQGFIAEGVTISQAATCFNNKFGGDLVHSFKKPPGEKALEIGSTLSKHISLVKSNKIA